MQHKYHDQIKKELLESLQVKKAVLECASMTDQIGAAADAIIYSLSKGGKALFCGNGGSAADSQHLAAELVSRYNFDRPGLAAISLATDTSAITAISNDYGYDQLFSRQVQALGSERDVLVGISTSGNSKNVIAAVRVAKAIGISTIALCGRAGRLKDEVDVAISVPSTSTPRIQEQHISVGHIICGIVERHFFADPGQ